MRQRAPSSSNPLTTSSISCSKHSFAIKPYIPKKRAPPCSISHSPIVAQSAEHRSNNGSKSLRGRKPLHSSRNIRTFQQSEEIKNELTKSHRNLKRLYSKLKESHTLCEQREQELMEENNKTKKELEEVVTQSTFFQHEFDRIKKECLKLLEIEGFKNKKMEQTLQEKELMIQYLKSQVDLKGETSKFGRNNNVFNGEFINSLREKNGSTHNNSNLSLASLEDILVIEAVQKDRFLQNSHHDSSITSLNFSKQKSSLFSIQSPFCSNIDLKQQNTSNQALTTSIENISFSLNRIEKEEPKFNNKKLPPEITIESPSPQESSEAQRKPHQNTNSRRKKSSASRKLTNETSMKSKLQVIDNPRKMRPSLLR